MGSVKARLLFTFLLSVLGVGASCWWYFNTERELDRGHDSENPMAYLKHQKKDVYRKPGTRLIWQNIQKGTPLYAGDAIKTHEHGEGEVALLKAGIVIKLEPDSVIVLEETAEGGAELNLLNGGLFLKQDGRVPAKGIKKAPVATIKAGQSKLVLGNKSTELTLAITDEKAAAINVTKGQVEMASEDEVVIIPQGKFGTLTSSGVDNSNFIKVTAPSPQAVFTSDENEIDIAWNSLAPEMKVYLEQGDSRSTLRRVGEPVSGEKGTLKAAFPVGTSFWRLVADGPGPKNMASPVSRLDIITVSPPDIFTPAAGEVYFSRKRSPISVHFSWRKPAGAKDVTITVANNPQLKKPVLHHTFGDASDYDFFAKEMGTYYWRASARWDGVKKVAAASGQFAVQPYTNLKPPVAISPSSKAEFNPGDASQGILLRWRAPPDGDTFEVHLSGPGDERQVMTTSLLEHRLRDLAPGTYQWRLATVGPDGQRSTLSPPREFTMSTTVPVVWKSPKTSVYEFATVVPSITVSWESSVRVERWRLRFAESKQDIEKQPWRISRAPRYALNLPQEGAYQFEVQGLSADGVLLAHSFSKVINVRPIPPLPPPHLAYADGEVLKAQRNGNIKVDWNIVKGARSYVVLLTNPKNGETREEPAEDNFFEFQSLTPGIYQLQLATVNKRGVKGEYSAVRRVQVPRLSDVSAPKDLKIKVN